MNGYDDYQMYIGDIHNHCAVGYGHGRLADAMHNAKLQLDFACVSVHAHWPDIPLDDPRLQATVDYHQNGFARSRDGWHQLQQSVIAHNQPGEFVTFLGYEMHSLAAGDYNVYFKDPTGTIFYADDLEDIRRHLRHLKEQGLDALLIPHHIGYRQGYRGINWEAFTAEFSPVAEIMSMHGASESPAAPYPYLHTMGPRDWHSTWQYGLAQGHIVGAIGSTDHHSAHPGSYGHGRMAVWAAALTRDAVWDAIQQRRTVALTGDNIALAFAINGHVLGSVVAPAAEREIVVTVDGCDTIDTVDVIHNNTVLHRHSGHSPAPAGDTTYKVYFEVGWGKKNVTVDWQISLTIEQGKLTGVEPRLRGHEIVAPQADEQAAYAFSQWQQEDANSVSLTTRTWGNPTTTTASTQGLCLEIEGNEQTIISGLINGQQIAVSLAELLQGPRSIYLGGFLTPACYFHRAVPTSESQTTFTVSHQQPQAQQRDWYYVRVRQVNNQWAWSSPIWVESGTA